MPDLKEFSEDLYLRGDAVASRTVYVGRQDVAGKEDIVSIDVPNANAKVNNLRVAVDLVRSVREYGLVPTDSGEAANNLTKFVTACQDISGSGGGILYFPPGTWFLDPVKRSLFGGENEMRYVSLRGAGIKATTIKGGSSATEALFDFDSLNYFDVSIEDLTFDGGGATIPHVLRFNSGGRHYRIALRNCWFRNEFGTSDGLVIANNQYLLLDFVVATNFTGWGIKLDSVIGVRGYIDVELCTAGGLLVEKTDALRDFLDIRLGVYSEQASNDVQFDNGAQGCVIEGINGSRTVNFRNGSRGNIVRGTGFTADFASGAHSNVAEGWEVVSSGVDARLNAVGTVAGAVLPFETPRPVLPTTDPERITGTQSTLSGGSLGIGNYLTRFWAYTSPGAGEKQINISINRGSNFYDFKDRTWKTSGHTNVKMGIGSGLRYYAVPFVTDTATSYTTTITLEDNASNSAELIFYDVDTVEEIYQARFFSSLSSVATFSSLTFTGEFRFETTFRYIADTDYGIVGVGSGSSGVSVGNGTTIKVGFVSGGQTSFTVPAMTAGTDYKLRVQRDGSNNVRVYLDDVESSTGAVSRTQDFTVDRLGDGQFLSNYNSRLQDTKFWSDEAGTTLIHHWFNGTKDLSDHQGSKDLTWSRDWWEIKADADS